MKPASGIQNGYPKNSRNLIGNYWCTVLLAPNGFWRDEFVYQTLRQPTQSILASSLSTISSRMDPWLLNLVLCKCTITYPSVRSEVGRISCEGKSLLKFFHVMTFYRNSNNNLYSLQHIFALSTIVLTRKEAATTVSRNTNRGGQAQIK